MSASWSDFLVAEGANLAEGRVVDFGDAQAERCATAQGGVMADLSPRAVLHVTGADAEAFLHAQLTCDVKALAVGQSSFGAYCTAKGRMLASFIILRVEEGYVLLLSRDIAPAIQKRLQMFVLRAKVKLEDASDAIVMLGLQGEPARRALTSIGYAPSTDVHHFIVDEGCKLLSLSDDRFILLAANETAAQRLWSQLKSSLRRVAFTNWEWLDITHGEPWISAATQEAFVPQMTNFEKIGGVSFKKGCYPGQEIVARTQYLGKANRRMHRVHSTEMIKPGDSIYGDAMGDQACGMVVNAAPAPESGWDALAVVHGNALEAAVHAKAPQGPQLQFGSLPYTIE